MTERKAILVTTSTFPRWPDDNVPKFVDYLSRGLSGTHDIIIQAPHYHGALTKEVIQHSGSDIHVHRFRYFFSRLQTLAYDGGMLSKVRYNPLNLLLVPFFFVRQIFNMRSLIRRYDIDVIHAHWIIPQGLSAAILSRLWRRTPPLLITAHGADVYALNNALLGRLKRWVLSRARTITVVSEAMKERCLELGVDDKKIVVRAMGVDLENTFVPGDAQHRIDRIIFVGRLVEKKGVNVLLEAISQLKSKHPTLRLFVLGDGPDRAKLESEVNRLQLKETVEFVGHVANENLPSYFRQCAVAVMPSIVAQSGDQEGLGLVAVEAMGCGCAVVASDLPAIRDTVRDRETGLIAVAGDATSLSHAISQLINDDALRSVLAENGRRFAVDNFDWKKVAARYAELLGDLKSTE